LYVCLFVCLYVSHLIVICSEIEHIHADNDNKVIRP